MLLTPAEIIKKLPYYLSDERVRHSIGVMNTAVYLSKRYGGERKKVELAALLHDVARDLPLSRMHEVLKDKQKHISSHIWNNPLLLHAIAGAEIAKKDFGIDDKEVLMAIRQHTTGGENMNLISKIIFISDYIEPGRNFRGVKKARSLALRGIDCTLIYIYKNLLTYLLREERYICMDTVKGYNSLMVNKDR